MKRKLEVVALCWTACMLVVVSAQVLTAPKSMPQTGASEVVEPKVLGAMTTQARGSEIVQEVQHPKQTTKEQVAGLTAAGFLVYDSETGDVLVSKNASTQYAIASLTKLMTALVAYENEALGKTASITSKDLVSVSPSLGLLPEDEVSLQDLFNSMLVGSENDAAMTLANHALPGGYYEFLKAMNGTAKRLGMANTNFSNPMGFDSFSNYSTAEDLQKLVTETQKLSAFTSLGRRTSYSFKTAFNKSFTTTTTNKLLASHEEIEAVKSGSTPSAKQSLISKISIREHKVIAIVLGSSNREKDTLTLEKFVQDNFIWE